MSEYISLDELKNDPVWKCAFRIGDKYGEGYLDGLDAVEEVIDNLLIIAVVRCKDCHWCKELKDHRHWCEWHDIQTSPGRFCSWGRTDHD